MSKNIKTHIYCYDDHRGFSEEVRKKFDDPLRYLVASFQTREELISRVEQSKVHNYCKVAILGLHDTMEQIEMIDKMTMEIKKIDPSMGLILIGPPDKMDVIKKTVKFNIDAYIPKNSNSILRIHNAVKMLISENGIAAFRKRSNISVYFLVGFLVLSIISLVVAYFRFPEYF
jgi:DNA-binding NarL/FixJ family response regulator